VNGIAIMGLCEPWLPSGLSFLSNLITGSGLSLEVYVIIGNIIIPFTLFLWIIGFSNLVYPNKTKVLGGVYIIIGVLFEIVFLVLLVYNPSYIANFSGESIIVHIDVEYRAIILLYLLFVVATIFTTGILFSRQSLGAEDPVIKFKGRFALIAPIVWSIAALLDTAIPLNFITLPITRILLVLSAIFYYFAFITPKKIKDYLTK
jgi:hypothetical protein